MTEFDEVAKNLVWTAAHAAPAADLRVFLRPSGGERTALSGLDALLTSPGILREFFCRRAFNQRFGQADAGQAHEAYIRSLTPGELADIVWRQLFIDHPPLSEAARIVLTTLGLYGLDVSSGDLRRLREQFDAVPREDRLEKTLKLANLDLVLYPVDVMEAEENPPPLFRHPAFRPMANLDRLLGDWKDSARRLRQRGYGLKAKVDEFAPLELRRFLTTACAGTKPALFSFDWPHGHAPGDGCVGKLVREGVLPLCREWGIPFAVTAGTGENLKPVDIPDIAGLWEENPEIRFLLFPTHDRQAPGAIQAAANSRNVLLCGPDGILAHPRTLRSFTLRRLEACGSAFHACHSGAETMEELVGRWAHLRWTVGKALLRHYGDLWRTGWRFSEAGIDQDARALFGANARTFLGL